LRAAFSDYTAYTAGNPPGEILEVFFIF